VLEAHAVHVEKDLRGEQPRPLVAVDEGMVRDDAKQLRCRHREQVVVCERAAERRLRLGDRRLEEDPITQVGAAAEAIELAWVQREYHLDREGLHLSGRVAHLASFR
jgi:hypothetical protein